MIRCAPSLQSLKLYFNLFWGMAMEMYGALCRVERLDRRAEIGDVDSGVEKCR